MAEQSDLEKIKERILSDSATLTIHKIPRKDFEKFQRLAKDQFNNDYSYAFKFLIDGIVNMTEAEFDARISALEHEVAGMKLRFVEKEEKTVLKPRLDGTMRRVKP
jgi:hypothetical protein